jgi:hypothetical protein
LASRFGTDLERFSAQVCRLIGCCVLAFATDDEAGVASG